MSSGNSQKTTQSATTQAGPWGPQQGYLENAFSDASNILGQQQGTSYNGNFVAQPTDLQTGTMQGLLNQAGQSNTVGNQAADLGAGMAGQGQAGAGTAMGGLFGIAGGNATQNNINAAGAYANNPYLQSQIDAANRPAEQQFNDSTMPGINQTAAGTGNQDSTRTGVAQGIAQRGLQNTEADTAANMRSQAYESGITQAQQDTATQAGALTSAGGIANSQSATGIGGLNAYGNILGAGANAANTASANITAQNQAPIDNSLQGYQFGQQNPYTQLNNYMGVVGSNNWGSQGSSTGVSNVQQQPSALNTAGSIAGILGSLFKSDRRVKENIRQIGVTPDGLFPLYRFNYINDEHKTEQVAPMAQDVEKVYPDAILDLGGVKHIMTHIYDWRI